MRNKEQHEGKGKGNETIMKCFSHLFHLFFIATSISRASPTPFAPRGHVKSHAHNEEMAYLYTEMHVFLVLLVQERSYEYSVGQRHSACLLKKKN